MISKFTAGKYLAVAALVGVGMAFGAMQASATVLTYEMDVEFSGAAAPAGTAPWVVATFDDGGGTGTVNLTLDTSGLVGTEFLGSFYFNLDPVFNAAALGFANQDTTDASFSSFTRGNDCCKADGDGFYDGVFTFNNGELTGGETWSIDLTLAGIDANSFAFIDNGGTKGDFHVAAHIQSIGADGNDSGWIGDGGNGDDDDDDVPEPAALGLLGLGLIGLAVVRRRRKIA